MNNNLGLKIKNDKLILPLLDDDYKDEELKSFLNKYNSDELGLIWFMIKSIKGYNLERISKILREVFSCKNEDDNELEAPRIIDLKNKNSLLEYRELILLSRLTEESSTSLDSINNKNVDEERMDLLLLGNSIIHELNKDEKWQSKNRLVKLFKRTKLTK